MKDNGVPYLIINLTGYVKGIPNLIGQIVGILE